MKAVEALLTLAFSIIITVFFYTIPPTPYSLIEYRYALLNDFYQLIDYGFSAEEIARESSLCIEFSKNSLILGEEIAFETNNQCGFKERIALVRCYRDPILKCTSLAIGV